ncbi:hypothetical protein [Nocardioides conyzicola]|uniref:DUF2020 domain-containing protein n=1 Tax=Nocardioides conyzicola TaxID=1651781 RepID=A0ABP8WTY0_9ACTN
MTISDERMAQVLRNAVSDIRADHDMAATARRRVGRRRIAVSGAAGVLAVWVGIAAVLGWSMRDAREPVAGGSDGRSTTAVPEQSGPMLVLAETDGWPRVDQDRCGDAALAGSTVVRLSHWDDACISRTPPDQTIVFEMSADPSPTGEELASVSQQDEKATQGDVTVRRLSSSRVQAFNSRSVSGIYSPETNQLYLVVSADPALAARILDSARLS